MIVGALENWNRSIITEEEPNGIYLGWLKWSKYFRHGVSTWIKYYIYINTTYLEYIFKRRISIASKLYYRLRQDIQRNKTPGFWNHCVNKIGRKCIPTNMKVLCALVILLTGTYIENLDDRVHMAEETIRKYLNHFCIDITLPCPAGRFYIPLDHTQLVAYFEKSFTPSLATYLCSRNDHGISAE